jgi:ferredoxin
LAAILIAALFSSQVAYLLDPITIITRAFTFALYPVVQLASRSLAGSDFVSERLPFLVKTVYLPSDVQYFYRLNFLAAVVLIGILAADSISRRYWCRVLCPLGALLGVLSRFSIFRRTVASGCTKCAKCSRECKMAAINEDPTQYQVPECIYCYSCTVACPALVTRIAPTLASEGYHAELNLERRRLVQAAGIGAAVALLGRTNAAAKTSRASGVKVSSSFLIRPPGALPEDQFVDRCLRCSECMKACPTGGLQPALTEAGFEGLWTPVLVPRIGECSQNCNLCSQVCSSQAIQPLEIIDKPHIFIGRAVIDRSQCIAWNSDKQCLVCDEACSYRAVFWRNQDRVRRPFVEEHKCVGCGICENVCPIQPEAAIRVFSFGDQRAKTRDQQKAFFDLAPKAGERAF